MRRRLALLLVLLALGGLALLALLSVPRGSGVVVYTALDRSFSEPILKEFERETGIRVRAKYDEEATKTLGLVAAIRAEAARPRCDVFWNNEIVNTIRLKEEGLLAPYAAAAAGPYPDAFKDPEHFWHGFAARARVLIVNTELVKPGGEPRSIRDLAGPKWRGRTGIAKPLFGTTATHAACLFAALGEEGARAFFRSLKQNGVSIETGNKQCALAVADGRLAFALTDTDDAIIEVEQGRPVKIVYPDADEGGLGVLFIPNTLALVKGGPNPEAGRKLIEFLLRPGVEERLAQCASAQIPLHPAVTAEVRVKTPKQVPAMKVDFGRAAADFEKAAKFIEEFFLE